MPLPPAPLRFNMAFSLALTMVLSLSLLVIATALRTDAGASPSSSASHAAFIQRPTRTWFGAKPPGDPTEGRRGKSATRGTWVPRLASRSERNNMSMAATTVPPRIIIAGAPASGKGTQCSMIKQKYGVVHLSTGDMLREAVRLETPVGMKAKGFMNEGKLVPDEVIIDIVRDRLAEEDCQNNGWLLDGFPRTRAQADALESAGIKADAFLLLNVPDEVLIARVVGRRLDPETGEIYHLEYNPPPAEIMDRVIHRADDTAEKARVRLDAYHANIAAIKACYEDVMCSLDGSQPKGTVFDLITSELDSRLSAGSAAATVGGEGEVGEVPTMPIEGMKPGTSGLRKKDEDA